MYDVQRELTDLLQQEGSKREDLNARVLQLTHECATLTATSTNQRAAVADLEQRLTETRGALQQKRMS